LARLESGCPCIGLEPACNTQAGVDKKVVRDETNGDHKKICESIKGFKYAKCFL
jgi:hypothetical protein